MSQPIASPEETMVSEHTAALEFVVHEPTIRKMRPTQQMAIQKSLAAFLATYAAAVRASALEEAAQIADGHAASALKTAQRGRKMASSPLMAFHENPDMYREGAECCEAAASEAQSIASTIRALIPQPPVKP